MEQNLAVREPQPLRKLFGGGVFGEFDWMPDAYDNCKGRSLTDTLDIIHMSKARDKSDDNMKLISLKPFIIGTDTFKCRIEFLDI